MPCLSASTARIGMQANARGYEAPMSWCAVSEWPYKRLASCPPSALRPRQAEPGVLHSECRPQLALSRCFRDGALVPRDKSSMAC